MTTYDVINKVISRRGKDIGEHKVGRTEHWVRKIKADYEGFVINAAIMHARLVSTSKLNITNYCITVYHNYGPIRVDKRLLHNL